MAERPSDRLNTPGRQRTWLPKVKFSEDAFGAFAEGFARFMGTARFLIWMTVFIIAWIVVNNIAPDLLNDPFPYIFLTLLLSLQASYAAPLILLAQNRQEARDRVTAEHDRQVAAQSRADMDFLAREIASLRMRINDMPTRDFIRGELRDLVEELSRGADTDAEPRRERRDKPAKRRPEQ
ncbi:DUF1003 domain-containing protein [Propioniciclava sinopodophylli]|uniref:DUF1003 domain-containing protein n=1 Tax=Propioniciclava sinopodophylli TaxID=1837344 RepID=UPI00248FC9C2|nr:DUF1003 domain-containing protein [Propioniciclava sinopodophylli]